MTLNGSPVLPWKKLNGFYLNPVNSPKENSWYTVNGVKLNGAPAAKGVYIHNGKKVVIK